MPTDLSAARPFTAAVVVAGLSATAAIGGAALLGLPIRDPDGFAGPAWVRLPVIALLFLAADVVPRVLSSRQAAGGTAEALRRVLRERWTRERLTLVAVGLLTFYISYVSYRNVKGFLPFARDSLVDGPLLVLDRAMTFGADPATVLHAVLGTGISAHVLSAVYLAFLPFVPLSLAASLVWTREPGRGAWYVTALCVNWAVGAFSYYLLPSLGPVYARPGLFTDLPVTGVTRLQEGLLANRVEFLTDPWATSSLNGIAAFASLHVSIVFTAALIAHLSGLHVVVRRMLWSFFALTVLSTVYFGWHYLLDDVAGVALGGFAVWVAALATGQHRRTAPVEEPRVLVAS